MSPRARRRLGAALGCALVVCGAAASSHAERVPIDRYVELRVEPWRHAYAVPAGDRARTGRSDAVAPAKVPSLRWSVRLPFRGLHPPLVLEDATLVVAGAGGVVALHADGSERWRRTTPAIAFAPTLTRAGALLLVSEAHELFAFGLDGEPRELAPTTPAVAGEPLVFDDGTTFVGTRDGRLLALDRSGAILRELPTTHRGAMRLAALGDGLVAAAGEDVVLSLASVHGGLEKAFTLSEPLAAGPVVSEGGTLWVIGQQGTLWSIAPGGSPRALAWLGVRGRRPAPAVGHDGELRVGADDLRCLAPSGSERWRRGLDASAGPIVLDAEDTALLVTVRGTLHAFARDGTLRWRVGVGEGADVRPVLAGDGTIYVALPSGRLSAWK